MAGEFLSPDGTRWHSLLITKNQKKNSKENGQNRAIAVLPCVLGYCINKKRRDKLGIFSGGEKGI